MQTSLILGTKAAATRNLLHLLFVLPKQTDLGANGASIAFCAFQLKFNPRIGRRDLIFVKQHGPSLICNYGIERPVITEIRQSDRAPIVAVRYANQLRHFFELSGAIVNPNALLLISRKASTLERRPVGSVGNNSPIAASNL